MPTVTIMQYERYGVPVIEGNSGLNARECARWSQNDIRGHAYPHNMEHPYNSGPYLDYDTWCSNMNAAGVNIIFLSLAGANRPWGGKSYSFEPPPHGTYNLFGSFLDDANLTTFRNGQTSATPPPAALWNTSNIKALLISAFFVYELGEIMPSADKIIRIANNATDNPTRIVKALTIAVSAKHCK